MGNYIIDAEDTIEEAMFKLNEYGTRILVVTEDGKAVGTITDGDLRRALLNKQEVNTAVAKIMNKRFISADKEEHTDTILSKMIENKVQTIPVLDKQGALVRIVSMADLVAKKKQQGIVVIMAGGKGTRLGNLTSSCPKPMLRVNGKPMLEIIIDQYKKEGFRKFILSVNYLKEKIVNYFGNGEKLGVNIEYIIEPKALGTAGSLFLINENINEPLLVTNGDVLSTTSGRALIQRHIENQVKATICVREIETPISYGVVEENEGRLTDIIEKPNIRHKINAGIYVIDPKMTKLIKCNEFLDMPEFLKIIMSQGYEVAVETISEYWLDIGRPETLEEAELTWTTTLRAG